MLIPQHTLELGAKSCVKSEDEIEHFKKLDFDDDDEDLMFIEKEDALEGKKVALTLEEKTDDIVAYGTIISINCNMLAVDCMCVAIDQAVDIDAPLPFPLSSSCQHVGDAVGSHEKKLELNSSSMPKSLWLLYCYYKRALDHGETIKVILDFDVFGETCTLYVNEEDVTPFCQLMPISYTCIGVYIWSLYKKMMDENKLDKFRFVHPYGVGHLPTTKTDTQFLEEQLEKRARALVDRLFDTPPNTAVLVPCNVGFHWILTVININKDIIYLLDPLGHRMRNDNWKHVVDMAMKMFHAVGKGKKGRSKTSWEIVKAPRQPDSNQCGFYVMAYMRTLIEHMPDIDDKESVQALVR
nr:putative Ulp1 protease family catalytic domain-containing protein [Ipomoea batatas]